MSDNNHPNDIDVEVSDEQLREMDEVLEREMEGVKPDVRGDMPTLREGTREDIREDILDVLAKGR